MKKYFYLRGPQLQGPCTLEELKKTNPHPTTLIWHQELQHWIHAKDSKDLRTHFGLSTRKLTDLKNILSRIFHKPSSFKSENIF